MEPAETEVKEQLLRTWTRLLRWHDELDRLLTEVAQGAEPPSPAWFKLVALYGLNATRVSKLGRDLLVATDPEVTPMKLQMNALLDELREETGWEI